MSCVPGCGNHCGLCHHVTGDEATDMPTDLCEGSADLCEGPAQILQFCGERESLLQISSKSHLFHAKLGLMIPTATCTCNAGLLCLLSFRMYVTLQATRRAYTAVIACNFSKGCSFSKSQSPIVSWHSTISSIHIMSAV